MPAAVAFLRAVNVGGHNKLPMNTLRDAATGLGLRGVRTYLQSGNLVFDTGERDLDAVARRLEAGIEERVGFRPAVILRTASQLRHVVFRNPFARRAGIDPAKLQVTFLARGIPPEAATGIPGLGAAREEIHHSGAELYVYYPDGMARTKLTVSLLEKRLGVVATGRNWNTVTALLALAECLSGGA